MGMARSGIRFGRFELRPETRELCAEGQALRIGERAFNLLLALVEAGGRPVSAMRCSSAPGPAASCSTTT
jgi:DNA-binding winged helix-turn-helix (wHTH) protein